MKRKLSTGFGLLFLLAAFAGTQARAADMYAMPNGAGSRDGSSWQNALDASKGGLQKGWDALKAGDTLWIGSGAYKAGRKGDFAIRSGGEAGKPRRIAGKDTGSGLPVFTGTFDRANPAKTGEIFIACSATTADGGNWSVQDIELHDYRMGVTLRGAALSGVHISHLNVTGCREGINIDGSGVKDDPASGIHDIEIRDCAFRNFTKRGMRLTNGCHDIRVTNCIADAGGKPWATEPFHMGYQIGVGAGAVQDHDITFIGCTASHSYDEQGGRQDRYWNADGFCAESNTYNLRFSHCRSFDNTDGGWDCKTKNITLEDCVALRNKRNFRLWGTATMTNCVGAYAIHYGGTGGADGLWASGKITARHCTFYNNGEKGGNEIEADHMGAVTLESCYVARDAAHKGQLFRQEEQGKITVGTDSVGSESAGATSGGHTGTPALRSPHADWSGDGPDFDNNSPDTQMGYSSTRVVVVKGS